MHIQGCIATPYISIYTPITHPLNFSSSFFFQYFIAKTGCIFELISQGVIVVVIFYNSNFDHEIRRGSFDWRKIVPLPPKTGSWLRL